MSSQKNLIIVGAVILLLLLGLGGYLFAGKNKAPQTSTQTQGNSSATGKSNNSQNSIQGTISSIFTSGQNKKCDFSVKATNGGSTGGTVYVSGNNARANLTMTTTAGKSSNTYLVRVGDTFYIWGDDLPTGIKMTMDVNEMGQKMQSSQSGFDPNKKIDFNCSNWTVDNTLFTPPSSVKFTDVGAMMPHATGVTPNASLCDKLTGQAKTACLNSMH